MNTKKHELFKVFRVPSCSFVANSLKVTLLLEFCSIEENVKKKYFTYADNLKFSDSQSRFDYLINNS